MKRADHHLVQQVLDGDISREGFDGFQKRLRENPELIELYGSYAKLHHNLSEEFEDTETSPLSRNPRSSTLRALRIPLIVAAALVVAFAAWSLPQWFFGNRHGNDVALASFSIDATWQIDGPSKPLGGATALTAESTLRLIQGRASISLKPSVNAIIEGPATLRFPSAEKVEIIHGKCLLHQSGHHNKLVVSTPQFSKISAGTSFGIIADPEQSRDDIFVIDGNLDVLPREEKNTTQLVKGDAIRSTRGTAVTRLTSQSAEFANRLDRFKPLASTPFRKSDWRISYGNPSISETRIEGANFSMYRKLDSQSLADDSIMLVSLQCTDPSSGKFHSEGWAGMSLFASGNEMLFLGDPYGPGNSWAIEIKSAGHSAPQATATSGSATMTLRYDSRNGAISLHEGGIPLKPAVYSTKIPPGIRFDEIRLGASAGAALAVTTLEVRASGE